MPKNKAPGRKKKKAPAPQTEKIPVSGGASAKAKQLSEAFGRSLMRPSILKQVDGFSGFELCEKLAEIRDNPVDAGGDPMPIQGLRLGYDIAWLESMQKKFNFPGPPSDSYFMNKMFSPSDSPGTFSPGDGVLVVALTSAVGKTLNGRAGRVIGEAPIHCVEQEGVMVCGQKGRYEVQVDGDTGRTVNLYPRNIKLLSEVEAELQQADHLKPRGLVLALRDVEFTSNGRVRIPEGGKLEDFASVVEDIARRVTYPNYDEVTRIIANDRGIIEHGPDGVVYSDETVAPFHENRYLVYAMDMLQAEDMTRFIMLSKNLIPSGLGSHVEVRSSAMHGNGVFARCKIKAGTFLTMYPADAISIAVDRTTTYWFHTNGDKFETSEAPLYYRYSALVTFEKNGGSKNIDISIAGNPDIYSSDACGHLINDGAMLENDDFGPGEMATYMRLSYDKQNCGFVPVYGCFLAVVATRDIKKDEELHTHYSPEFWAHSC